MSNFILSVDKIQAGLKQKIITKFQNNYIDGEYMLKELNSEIIISLIKEIDSELSDILIKRAAFLILDKIDSIKTKPKIEIQEEDSELYEINPM